ncbi:hypothetical protein BDN70DRAFT_805805 [Pholiota conissans]|uniref:Phytocyanin domain-containing protein n=1 Tax=Pholiota conissans TaxID=109636 RepID=A0A9P6CU58_9AGAR|nr:hypothetical protein BDN70DRAFT_805805 [Pholiota conissans]
MSSSSYGSSSSGYGSSGSYGSGSDNSWSSSVATSTSTAWSSYSTPSYGSGSSNWDSSGYNDCVSQCMANYGGMPSSYTPSTTSGSSSGSSGSGATHTVIVAPTQGVLRYVPFALNASVGDTIQFMWGANNHTVTKSSELTPCNKTSDTPFTTGEQNKGFMFTQVVNDTNPLFFYCGTPTHCQKGMFGIINPPNAAGATTSVSGMMQSIAANSSDVMGYAAFTQKSTAGNTAAATWGSNIDLASLPAWSHEFVAENVLYTRNFLAANTDVLQDDGTVNLGAAGSNPLMIPQDLAAALSSASPATTGSTSATTPAAAQNTPATSASAAAASAPANSGALSMSSSKVVVGLVAAFATFMMM